jgi:TatA/E family protein of Tat protein translocase
MFRNPTTDLIIVLVIVLLIFGPKRLPGLGRQLGQGLREFKESITGESKDDEGGERPEIARASQSPVAASTGTPSEPVGAPAPPPSEPRPVEASSAARQPGRGPAERSS